VRTAPRLLAGLVAVVIASAVAAGCDTAPYAATVNGQVTKATALNAELSQLSANTAYIKEIDQNNASAGASVEGSAPGTYSAGWTAHVLSGIVTAAAVQQYLSAHHDLPGPAQLDAARAVQSADYGALWDGFPAAYRTTLTDRAADLAQVETTTAPSSQISTAYKEFANYFFTQVCVRTAAVTVAGAGGVDYARSLAAADQLARTIDTAQGGAAKVGGGQVTCYSTAAFETQTPGFTATILKLATGKAAAPQKTAYGYQVIAVASRQTIPLDATLSRALSVAISAQSSSSAVDAVLARARIKINPSYGTWGGSASKGFAVAPPSATSGAS
jgi:hypothetical protein